MTDLLTAEERKRSLTDFGLGGWAYGVLCEHGIKTIGDYVDYGIIKAFFVIAKDNLRLQDDLVEFRLHLRDNYPDLYDRMIRTGYEVQ